jgi:DNA-binding Xre family transcriptional regulator
VLEKMEEEHISVRALAQKAGVSPTVIQKIRSQNAEKITFRTFTNVLKSLGYKINIEKI